MVVANSIIEDMNMRFGTVDIFEKTVKLTFTTRIDSCYLRILVIVPDSI
jgi:hypothetical protein